MANFAELINSPDQFAKLAGEKLNRHVYQASVTAADNTIFALSRNGIDKMLLVACDGKLNATGFQVDSTVQVDNVAIALCPLTHENALALRRRLGFLVAKTLGVKKSFGAGDRLGLATPGHALAVARGSMKPIFCQQSIREMTRTQRTPDNVMDDACWGVFQAGYRDGFGADADHLKNTDDIDVCLAAGFTFYTIDPGDHVDSSADTDETAKLIDKYNALDWDKLLTTANDCKASLAGKEFTLEGPTGSFKLSISEDDLLRAAVKYGKAIAHVATMYNYLKDKAGAKNFEFEVSVDETETPTTIAEHYYVASELGRLGIQWVSLAPRFVGDFEKGVDYIGNLEQFRSEFAKHVAIAKRFGPYKISLHSGSDKFSIYPIAAELAGDWVHLKTAGTSYLEALRAIAQVDTALFREILTFAKQRYPQDRATYHVSAVVSKVANQGELSDSDLPGILDQFDTREACHVTYGSVLQTKDSNGKYIFREQFFQTLRKNEQVYYDILDRHIGKHISPFG